MTQGQFVVYVSHILLSGKLNDIEKLNCIKLRYLQLSFPEHKLDNTQLKLLDKVYED